MEADTEALRSSAPQWSLAGDKQLLGVLQNIHERLVSRCQETNKRLGDMAAALDDASIDLQNVNNKFMALSNSQFVESRVYDDDADVAAPVDPPKEPLKAEPISELEKIKIGLKVLEDMHEPLQILDSDSDTDTEEEISRMVLKPKDLYSDRPLPYIIGSYAWRSKWHAGLLPEDSDTDSSVKREPWEREEYSESDTELGKPAKDQESISSDEFESEQVTPSQSAPAVPKSQASVANELARRLRGELPEPEQQPEEEYAPPPAASKVYRPEKPAPSNIFLDEPPPLEQSYQSSDEDDIFAELRRNQPYSQSNKMQSSVTDELFGEKLGADDIFSDFTEPPPVIQKSTLFPEQSEPELFTEPPPPLPNQETTDGNVKKPVGGVSLFGNKGTESIGAAILKRNQRQSFTDEDVSDDNSTSQNDKQKDIFDHLFAKSEKEQRNVEKNVEQSIKEPTKEVKIDKKVDLFSDNLFDDIDDIFTSNIPKVPVKTANKNQKSLFDDDDDLFSTVAVAKNSNTTVKDTKDSKKSIFDSDDDLFSDKAEKNISSKDTSKSKDKISINKKEVSVKSDNKKSIFDSDDELFTDKTNKHDNSEIKKHEEEDKHDNRKSVKERSEVTKNNTKTKSIFDDSDSDIFSDNAETKTKEISVNSVMEEKTNINTEKSKEDRHEINQENETVTPVLDTQKLSLFDDEEEDLFKTDSIKDIKKKNEEVSETDSIRPKISKEQITDSIFNDEPTIENTVVSGETVFTSAQENKSEKPKKSIFDDDSEDELFVDKPKLVATKSVGTKSNSMFGDDDVLFKESVPTISHISKEEILKNEIKEEILDEIKEEIKSEIKDEVITELKDDLLLDKNIQNTEELEKNSQITKPFEKDEFDDEDDIFKGIKEAVSSNDKIESTKKSAIFDVLEGDLFSNTVKNIDKNVSRIDATLTEEKAVQITEAKKSEIPELKADKEINKTDTGTPPVLQAEKASVFDKPDIFTDIFTEPPKFEKPKEPKKSKNVNALFDDDSDDEALFFKKNDPTLDEKPEFESPSIENRLFGIFQDEPPALDVDFVQKTNVKSKDITSALTDTESETFNEKPNNYVSSISKDQIDYHTMPEPTAVVQTGVTKSLEIPEKDIPKTDVTPKKDSDRTDNAPKPIGKLKTMNFNINVNALLPGASPKKVKPTEQTDGNTQTKTKSSEDIHVKNTPEVEPKMVKSISFEGKPESQVLDNKLSKERAKIQVKRRPSTRRARKEAVRKSGIDFGDDSTDNSSSIDDQPKDKTERFTDDENKAKVKTPDDNKVISQSIDVIDRLNIDEVISTTTETKQIDNEKNIFDTVDLNNENPSEETKPEPVDSSTIITKDQFLPNESQFNTDLSAVTKEDKSQKPEVTTKTVYILNDEDIFNIEKPKKVLNIVDDDNPGISTSDKESKKALNFDSDDELFRNLATKSTNKEADKDSELFKSQIKNTSGLDDDAMDSDDNIFKTRTESKKDFESKSIDQNLFKTKTINETDSKNNARDADEQVSKPHNVKKDVKKDKISIFDLSDDEDLFSNNKRKTSEVFKKEVKKVDVKASLFGDEDDDDLFGSSSKKIVDAPSSSQPTRPKEVITKSTEAVFEDPLSLLGGDDD